MLDGDLHEGEFAAVLVAELGTDNSPGVASEDQVAKYVLKFGYRLIGPTTDFEQAAAILQRNLTVVDLNQLQVLEKLARRDQRTSEFAQIALLVAQNLVLVTEKSPDFNPAEFKKTAEFLEQLADLVQPHDVAVLFQIREELRRVEAYFLQEKAERAQKKLQVCKGKILYAIANTPELLQLRDLYEYLNLMEEGSKVGFLDVAVPVLNPALLNDDNVRKTMAIFDYLIDRAPELASLLTGQFLEFAKACLLNPAKNDFSTEDEMLMKRLEKSGMEMKTFEERKMALRTQGLISKLRKTRQSAEVAVNTADLQQLRLWLKILEKLLVEINGSGLVNSNSELQAEFVEAGKFLEFQDALARGRLEDYKIRQDLADLYQNLFKLDLEAETNPALNHDRTFQTEILKQLNRLDFLCNQIVEKGFRAGDHVMKQQLLEAEELICKVRKRYLSVETLKQLEIKF